MAAELINDCCQLTKANSIDGNKRPHVTVIYTPWTNLYKSADMVAGQVGFKDQSLVRRVKIDARENACINRLNKTREERFPDLEAERDQRDRRVKARNAAEHKRKEKEAQRLARERKLEAEQRKHAYDDLFTQENMASAQSQRGNLEDDFW